MFATAIIVFREVLEAALIVSIVLAASKGVAGRGRWVSGGVVLGVLGACVVAAFAGAISSAVQGAGQELLNATILLLAVLMLGWHNVWMSKHGRALAGQMSAVGHDVASGRKPLSVLLIVCAVAVVREGSEVVLFTYAIAAGGAGAKLMLAGGGLGLAAGVGAGALLYKGLLRIPTRYLFSVTGWLILLLAAGMAADAAGFLVQAGWLPAIIPAVWNTSAVLTEHSIVGRVLHILIGYTQRPSAIQVMFYVATIAAILSLSRWVNRPRPQAMRRAAAEG